MKLHFLVCILAIATGADAAAFTPPYTAWQCPETAVQYIERETAAQEIQVDSGGGRWLAAYLSDGDVFLLLPDDEGSFDASDATQITALGTCSDLKIKLLEGGMAARLAYQCGEDGGSGLVVRGVYLDPFMAEPPIFITTYAVSEVLYLTANELAYREQGGSVTKRFSFSGHTLSTVTIPVGACILRRPSGHLSASFASSQIAVTRVDEAGVAVETTTLTFTFTGNGSCVLLENHDQVTIAVSDADLTFIYALNGTEWRALDFSPIHGGILRYSPDLLVVASPEDDFLRITSCGAPPFTSPHAPGREVDTYVGSPQRVVYVRFRASECASGKVFTDEADGGITWSASQGTCVLAHAGIHAPYLVNASSYGFPAESTARSWGFTSIGSPQPTGTFIQVSSQAYPVDILVRATYIVFSPDAGWDYTQLIHQYYGNATGLFWAQLSLPFNITTPAEIWPPASLAADAGTLYTLEANVTGIATANDTLKHWAYLSTLGDEAELTPSSYDWVLRSNETATVGLAWPSLVIWLGTDPLPSSVVIVTQAKRGTVRIEGNLLFYDKNATSTILCPFDSFALTIDPIVAPVNKTIRICFNDELPLYVAGSVRLGSQLFISLINASADSFPVDGLAGTLSYVNATTLRYDANSVNPRSYNLREQFRAYNEIIQVEVIQPITIGLTDVFVAQGSPFSIVDWLIADAYDVRAPYGVRVVSQPQYGEISDMYEYTPQANYFNYWGDSPFGAYNQQSKLGVNFTGPDTFLVQAYPLSNPDLATNDTVIKVWVKHVATRVGFLREGALTARIDMGIEAFKPLITVVDTDKDLELITVDVSTLPDTIGYVFLDGPAAYQPYTATHLLLELPVARAFTLTGYPSQINPLLATLAFVGEYPGSVYVTIRVTKAGQAAAEAVTAIKVTDPFLGDGDEAILLDSWAGILLYFLFVLTAFIGLALFSYYMFFAPKAKVG